MSPASTVTRLAGVPHNAPYQRIGNPAQRRRHPRGDGGNGLEHAVNEKRPRDNRGLFLSRGYDESSPNYVNPNPRRGSDKCHRMETKGIRVRCAAASASAAGAASRAARRTAPPFTRSAPRTGFDSPAAATKKSSYLRRSSWRFKGGDEGNRTLGLCHATAALSQLSYVPETSVYDSKQIFAVNNKLGKKWAAPRFTKMNPPLQGGCPHRPFQRP